jgi:hypothetical protein
MSYIWCLGIVYMEMVVALKGETTQYMDDFFKQHGKRDNFVRLNTAALLDFATHLSSLGLRIHIITPIRVGGGIRLCGLCCANFDEEYFSDYDSD